MAFFIVMKQPELIKINTSGYSWHHMIPLSEQLNEIWHWGFVDLERSKVIRKVISITCGIYIYNHYKSKSDFNASGYFENSGFVINIIFDPLLEPYESFLRLDPLEVIGFKLTELDETSK